MSEHSQSSMGIQFFRISGFFKISGFIALLLFISNAISGIVLSSESDVNSFLKPEIITATHISKEEVYVPIPTLKKLAISMIKAKHSEVISLNLDHIELYDDKGTMLFLYQEGWAVQIEAKTGRILEISKMKKSKARSIHDASLLDEFFHTDGIFKKGYTILLGSALLIFSITGLWLWIKPNKNG